MEKKTLVGLDRDGTINLDDGFFGIKDDWRERLEFHEGIAEGIRMLNQKEGVYVTVATNQVGVARGFYTTQRIEEIHQEISRRLAEKGARIDDWQYFPYVDPEYARRKGIEGSPWVSDTLNIRKPHSGMVLRSVERLGFSIQDFGHIFFIGDRASDVETGLNLRGIGIFVMTGAYEEYVDSVEQLSRENPGRVYIAKDFLGAASKVLELIE